MRYWVHGRERSTGDARDPLFLEGTDERDARLQAAEAGMDVEEIEEVVEGVEDGLDNIGPPETPLVCAKCGSAKIVPKAHIWDQGQSSGGTLQAYVYARPDALMFKEARYATLFARVCGDCGYTEIYAEGAAILYQAYQQSRAGRKPRG